MIKNGNCLLSHFYCVPYIVLASSFHLCLVRGHLLVIPERNKVKISVKRVTLKSSLTLSSCPPQLTLPFLNILTSHVIMDLFVKKQIYDVFILTILTFYISTLMESLNIPTIKLIYLSKYLQLSTQYNP